MRAAERSSLLPSEENVPDRTRVDQEILTSECLACFLLQWSQPQPLPSRLVTTKTLTFKMPTFYSKNSTYRTFWGAE